MRILRQMASPINLVSQNLAFVRHMHFGLKPRNTICASPVRPRRNFSPSSSRARIRTVQMRNDRAPVSAKTLFTEDIARAETLFKKCVFSVPEGASAMATSRDVDMPLIAKSYGHVLAKSILDTIPVKLDEDRLASGCFAAAEGRSEPLPLPPFVFEQWLASVKSSTKAEKTDPKQISMLSEMYGHMLGRTVRLTAFELDGMILANSLKEKLQDPKTVFPMPEEDYERMFGILEACATAVLGTSNLDSADRFFGVLKEEADVWDVQGDGYILSVSGGFVEKGGKSRGADPTQTVRFAWRVRLLDGRCLFLPNFSDGDDKEPDFYEATMERLTPALKSILMGMKVGETRTAFFHPYAALEVLEMVMPADQFPPQAGLVVDLYLNEIV